MTRVAFEAAPAHAIAFMKSRIGASSVTKPLLQFSHANGFPAGCYRLFLDALADRFDVRSVAGGHLFPFERPEQAAAEVLAMAALLEVL